MRYNYKDSVRKHIMRINGMLKNSFVIMLRRRIDQLNLLNDANGGKRKFIKVSLATRRKIKSPTLIPLWFLMKGKAQVLASLNPVGKFLCKFFKKEGHAQRDYEGFRAWLVKNGTNVVGIVSHDQPNLLNNANGSKRKFNKVSLETQRTISPILIPLWFLMKGKAQVLASLNPVGKFLCKFFKKEGHAQRDYDDFRAWLAKNSTNVVVSGPKTKDSVTNMF
uniref:Uncharacterized protein n=1 Tax=Oryza nivara TaxID=4536 RepID=A0A0E0GPU8_ORYNI